MGVVAFALLLGTAAITVAQEQINVLAVGAIRAGLTALTTGYQGQTGHNVQIQFATAPELARRVASGEAVDILIAPPAVVDEAERAGRTVAGTRAVVGRVGIGITVRGGAPLPDVRTVDAFREALLRADAIVYNEGSSGLYLDTLFVQMGIAEQLQAKTTRHPNGDQVLNHIMNGGGNEIGLAPMTVLTSNDSGRLQFAGPLPPDVQNYTTYEMVLMTGARSADTARSLIRHLSTPAAKQTFAANGVD